MSSTRIEVWVHGSPAHSFGQIQSFLSGDAHDRSKVQLYRNTDDFDTSGFMDWPLPDEKPAQEISQAGIVQWAADEILRDCEIRGDLDENSVRAAAQHLRNLAVLLETGYVIKSTVGLEDQTE